MKLTCGNLAVYSYSKEIPILDAADIFSALRNNGDRAFLFESRSVNPIYGRMSLVGIDPILELSATGNKVAITVLNSRGEEFFSDFVLNGIGEIADVTIEKTNNKIVLSITKDTGFVPEEQRSRRKNTVTILHRFLEYFRCREEALFGLYGAFSYDFVRLFEDIPDLHTHRDDIPDYRFFLFDSFVRLNLIREKSEVICFRNTLPEAEQAASAYAVRTQKRLSTNTVFSTGNISCDVERAEYEKLVLIAKDLAKRGELFEVVFSRCFSGKFDGDPFAVYRIYREKNPAPYLFFFDFADSQLVGASPEMMVRVEQGKAHLRPISGTRPRGEGPISDHEYMLELLISDKERAELDMLIDLGRNDLKRVCEPGIEITAYRAVERYSRVMHTIAHLTGKLREDCTALDALIACQSAGTLTGAPKVQAMIEIERYEKSRRGYYGGSIGYLTFSGDMDTGIIIRTAHIHNGAFEFRVGATLLFDSDPHAEYLEVESKARALLEILKGT